MIPKPDALPSMSTRRGVTHLIVTATPQQILDRIHQSLPFIQIEGGEYVLNAVGEDDEEIPPESAAVGQMIPCGMRFFLWPDLRWWEMGRRGHYVDILIAARDDGTSSLSIRGGFGSLVAYGRFIRQPAKWWQSVPIRALVALLLIPISQLRHLFHSGFIGGMLGPYFQLARGLVRATQRSWELVAPTAFRHATYHQRVQNAFANALYKLFVGDAVGELRTSPHRKQLGLALRDAPLPSTSDEGTGR